MIRLARRARITTAAFAATMVVASCSAAASSPSPTAGLPSGRPAMSPPELIEPSPSTAPVVGEVPGPIVATARAMLAEKIGAGPAANATLVVAEAVTWPDGSLGCPVPGEYYTQQLVPGYRIVLEVDGTRYDFRATEAGNVRACEPAGPRAP